MGELLAETTATILHPMNIIMCLVILVGIPLPGTGAWTGALVASVLDIRMRHALPAIFLGLVIAAAITTAVTLGLFNLLI